jgi:hypothetical protein
METLASTRAAVQHQPTQKLARPATLQRKCACGGETHGGGECEQCRKKRERTLQRTSYGGRAQARAVPRIVHEVLARPGHPLDERTRVSMESRFGRDFSGVRLHHDSTAATAARSVYAHAFTVGEHVVFGAGQFAPNQPHGRRLVAHELAHVVQQRGATPAGAELSVSTDEQAEVAADRAAAREMNGTHVGNVGVTHSYSAQREEEKSVFGSIASKVSSGIETVAIKSISTPARAVSPIAGRLVEAMLWGMLDEYKVQSPDRGAQAWERVKEAAKSPLVFLKNYWWGVI